MRVSKTQAAALMIGAVIASRLVACSPTPGTGSQGNPQGTAGSGSALGGSGNGTGTGSTGNFGAGGDTFTTFNSGGAGPGGGAGGGVNADCPPLVQKPEQIITYRDASVTDTITTYKPVALYIMQDISSSMVGTLGDPNSWPNSLAAVTAFVQDPGSAGLDVGLAVFPTGGSACDGTDCGKPVVEIGPLPQNSAALVSGMQASKPPVCCNFTPTECALNGMINHCKDWTAKSGEPCVAILVTDGSPTTCDTTQADLVTIVAAGKTAGVQTFTIGLPGSDVNFLNQLAQAGGTNAAIDVSSGSAAFIAALNKIRGSVSTQSVTHISVPMTISTPLPCEWKIPVPANNGVFDKSKVNVKYTPPAGAAGLDFGYVTQADCARADNAWYFDDPTSPNPAKVLLCPGTCDKVKAEPGASVEISFNCPQKPAVLK